MNIVRFVRRLAGSVRRSSTLNRRPQRPRTALAVEALEDRVTPYVATGNVWPHPQLINISFVPDGTVMALGNGGTITSNLFQTFGRIPGVTSASQWQNLILKAAQQWAQQTNLNFSLLGDDGESAGSGAYQQGNSNFGDIRIGGYAFGCGSNWLASTFYPPSVNNYSVAGDVAFNTGNSFNIGSTYDLFTVATHEIGHALGLACSNSSSAVMYGTYNGAFTALGSDDIAGIRSLYSSGNARSYDAHNSNGQSNGTFATATNIKPTFNTNSLASLLTGLDLTAVGQSQYFSFTVPSNSAGTMSVTVQSAGLSLLTPKLTVYNASKVAIGGAAFSLPAGGLEDGATLTLKNLAVAPGATYYVMVQGVDRTAFSTGAYALTLNLGTGPSPLVPLPSTLTANGNPLSAGGGTPMESELTPSGRAALYGLPPQAQNGMAHASSKAHSKAASMISSVQSARGSPLASLSGVVLDAATGTGLAGVTVTLTGTNSNGQSVTVSTTTDANGNYSFTGLQAGTYAISQTVPIGYKDDLNMIGSLGASMTTNAFTNISLAAGQNGYGYGFEDLLTST